MLLFAIKWGAPFCGNIILSFNKKKRTKNYGRSRSICREADHFAVELRSKFTGIKDGGQQNLIFWHIKAIWILTSAITSSNLIGDTPGMRIPSIELTEFVSFTCCKLQCLNHSGKITAKPLKTNGDEMWTCFPLGKVFCFFSIETKIWCGVNFQPLHFVQAAVPMPCKRKRRPSASSVPATFMTEPSLAWRTWPAVAGSS